MRRTTITWNGREGVPGEELEFDLLKGEVWSKYKTSDGSIVKVKTLLIRAVRLDQRDAEGVPVVVVFTQNVIITQVQPHLMVNESARTAVTPPLPVGEENQEKPTP